MTIKKSFLLPIWSFFIFCSTLYAQNPEAFLKELNTTTDEKTKIDILNKLGRSYMTMNRLDSAMHYYQQALELSEKIDYKRGSGTANHDIGAVYRLNGKYSEAKNHFYTALKIWEEIDEKAQMASAWQILSTITTDYKQAEQYCRLALKYFEKTGDKYKASATYQSLANIYYAQSNYIQALENFYASLKLAEEIGSKQAIAYNHLGISTIHVATSNLEPALSSYIIAQKLTQEIGDIQGELRAHLGLSIIYRLLKDYDKALEHQTITIDLSEKTGNKHLMGANIGNSGRLHEAKGDYTKALKAYLDAVKILEEVGDKRMLGGMSYYAGNIYNQLNQPNEAINLFEKSLELGKELGVLSLMADNYDGLHIANNLLGNHQKAYENLQKYITYKDSIYNEENTKKLTRLEVQYEADKKQDSLKFAAEQEQLAIQKEMQLAALRYEYEKKQAEAQSEEERRQILLEEEVKRQQIVSEHAIALAENKRKEAEMLAEQQQKDAETQLKIEREKGIRNLSLAGLALVLGMGGLLLYQNISRKKHNEMLRALNAELDEANRVKTRFFSILNHDLRGPVANLIQFLHLKKENADLLDEATNIRLEQKTLQNAETLLSTMEDLLLWSKGQMENFEPQMKKVEIEHLFDDIRNSFSDTGDVLLKFDNPQNLSVITDENYLKTIIYNLTSNAIKAMKDTSNPELTWKASLSDEKILLSVTDNGPGANSEKFKALYDDKQTIGIKTGLGMHIIRDLAKAIHLKIEVDIAQKKGTIIRLLFDSSLPNNQ